CARFGSGSYSFGFYYFDYW
nr:immunoglobulin heavy chain junction region [Macaca mulatta]MOX68961.1 immunoglobulin heavy chain junction region [Macaca mulatta]